MYLIDTDIISELRKGDRAHPGVRRFFADASRDAVDLYLSVITIGELRTLFRIGVEGPRAPATHELHRNMRLVQ